MPSIIECLDQSKLFCERKILKDATTLVFFWASYFVGSNVASLYI